MSRMNSREALVAAKVGNMDALWTRIDAGEFPSPVEFAGGACYWDSDAVYRAILPELKKRERTQLSSRTRERKDPARTVTRESE